MPRTNKNDGKRPVITLPREQQLEVRAAIKEKYRLVASDATGFFTYQTGRQGALALGYDSEVVATLPDVVLQSFCGVGNPFSIAPIQAGALVLDIGCGAGFDMIVAARYVGERGVVHGVDLTPEMIERAMLSMTITDTTNGYVHIVTEEELPYDDASFDVVISNGVINLSVDKPRLFSEIYRVLKPGGTLQFADVIQSGENSPPPARSAESWAQ
jgi:arsenite methyltransferase